MQRSSILPHTVPCIQRLLLKAFDQVGALQGKRCSILDTVAGVHLFEQYAGTHGVSRYVRPSMPSTYLPATWCNRKSYGWISFTDNPADEHRRLVTLVNQILEGPGHDEIPVYWGIACTAECSAVAVSLEDSIDELFRQSY